MKKVLIGISLVIALTFCLPSLIEAKSVKGDLKMSPETEEQGTVVQIHEVQAAYYAWTKAMAAAKGDPTHIVKLYAPDAILLPTLSDKAKFNNKNQLTPYFKSLTSNDQLAVKTTKLITYVFGDVAVNTGFYTFSFVNTEHKVVELPARFTFVYKLDGKNNWLILTHHSSVLPKVGAK